MSRYLYNKSHNCIWIISNEMRVFYLFINVTFFYNYTLTVGFSESFFVYLYILEGFWILNEDAIIL